VSSHYRIVPAGESAVIVEFEERIDPAVNATTIACADALQAAMFAGVRDVVPTYRSVAIYFDPLRTDTDALLERITHEAEIAGPGAVIAREPLRIPVCYGGDLGPDLPQLAAFAKMSPDDVVQLHASAIYRVFMVGFVPASRISAPSPNESPCLAARRRACVCRPVRLASPGSRPASIRRRRRAAGS